jgi:nucleotide-binding universal stress UspA family protein
MYRMRPVTGKRGRKSRIIPCLRLWLRAGPGTTIKAWCNPLRYVVRAMRKNILLAVDAASSDPVRHVVAASEMTRELAGDSGDHVIVLHVHEFAVGRFGRIRVDCGDGEGESVVDKIVSDLKAAGVSADGEISETKVGHIAAAIMAAAQQHDVRLVVLGSSSRTDLPRMPLGSVAARLLHMSSRPVLIVPRPDLSD